MRARVCSLGIWLAAAGCADGEGLGGKLGWGGATFTGAAATPSEVIPTVFEVTWTSDGEGPGAVAWGLDAEDPDDERGIATATAVGEPGDDGQAWRALVVGMPEKTDGWFQPIDGDDRGELLPVSTGAADGWVPDLESVDGEGEGAQGFVLAGAADPSQIRGPVIVDAAGRPVWWYWLEDQGAYNTRASLSPDGQSIYYNSFFLLTGDPREEPEGITGIFEVSLDGTELEIYEIPDHHHDFWLHDDGELVYIAFDEREVEGVGPVRGDALIARSPDGTERVVFSTWDALEYVPGVSPDVPEGHWTLMNTLEYDARDDTYWVSLKNLNTLAQIDRSTGELLRSIGEWGEIPVDDPLEGAAFENQHGFDLLDDGGILLFDNGPVSATDSRAIELSLTDDRAEITWALHADPTVYAFYQGDALQLDSGNRLIVWSTDGRIEEVDPTTDAVVRRLTWEEGSVFTFARYLEAVTP